MVLFWEAMVVLMGKVMAEQAQFGGVEFVTAQQITSAFTVYLYSTPTFVLTVFDIGVSRLRGCVTCVVTEFVFGPHRSTRRPVCCVLVCTL
jgi:hypothetical protein